MRHQWASDQSVHLSDKHMREIARYETTTVIVRVSSWYADLYCRHCGRRYEPELRMEQCPDRKQPSAALAPKEPQS